MVKNAGHATSLWIIRISHKLTVFALDFEMFAMFHAVVLHVSAHDAEAAPEFTLQELMRAFLEMAHGLLVRPSEIAFGRTAFEFKCK